MRARGQTRDSAVRPAYPLLARSGAAPVAVCYLAGSFTGIPAVPGHPGRYRRLIVIVAESSGGMTLDAAGPASSWSFGPPLAS